MADSKTCYKFRSFGNVERILDILLNERLYCSTYHELNDPFEGQFLEEITIDHTSPAPWNIISALNGGKLRSHKNVDLLIEDPTELPRICSLSSDLKDVRIWSHYADSHRGVAIEFEFPAACPQLHHVTYSPSIRKYGVTILAGPTVEKVLTEKTKHWEYESEYRILSKNAYFPVKGMIRSVYFGIRASPETVRLIYKATSGKFPFRFCRLNLDTTEVRWDPSLTLEKFEADNPVSNRSAEKPAG